MVSVGNDGHWTSWSGHVRCRPARFVAPRDEAEVAAAVQAVAHDGLRVRVAGSGHSFFPLVATDGVLLSLDALAGVAEVDEARREAWVLAGTKLHALGPLLLAHGLALANQGDIDRQALAGALATGTHGTGRGLGSLSTQVRALRAIDPRGEVLTLDEADGSFDGARAALGLYGVVTRARLALVPAYRLHERVWRTDLDTCLAELDERIAATRHFEFFWYPKPGFAELKALHPTEASPESVAGREGERIDWSFRIFPSERDQRFQEMEYAVPVEAARPCFDEIVRLQRERHADVVWPLEYRTLAADTAWLGQAWGRDVVTISLHQDARRPCEPFFRDAERVFAAYGARPHLGKLHWRTRADLAALYPRFEDFVATRRALDPEGRFLNDALAPLFG